MALLSWGVGMAVNGFGKKPTIPELPKLDPSQIQQSTVAGNAAAMPGIEALASRTNAFNQSQQLGLLAKALEFALPGGLGKAQGIIDSQLSGEIPADVNAYIQRQSAAQAMSGGFGGGSGLGRNLTLRDLGLTSLGMQQQGLSNFQSLGSMFAPPPAFDITSMFFTPQQRTEMAFRDRSDRFNRNLMDAQVKAAPDPWRAALVQAVAADEQSIMTLIGNVAGAAAKSGAACWVARAVYGQSDFRWLIVRHWLLTQAPRAFREFYLKNGERIADEVNQKPALRALLRPHFDKIVNFMLRRNQP